jgi:AcrR family transcriptional regulator
MLEAEILDATHEILIERGYQALSMDELAAHVGISKPTLYSHFATKDDIVIATIQRMMDQFIALISNRSDERTPFEHLLYVMRRLQKFQLDKTISMQAVTPELFKLILSREEGREMLRSLEDALQNLIQSAIESGEIDPTLDPYTVAAAFFSLSHSLHHAHLSGVRELHPQACDMILTIFERGVRASKEQ